MARARPANVCCSCIVVRHEPRRICAIRARGSLIAAWRLPPVLTRLCVSGTRCTLRPLLRRGHGICMPVRGLRGAGSARIMHGVHSVPACTACRRAARQKAALILLGQRRRRTTWRRRLKVPKRYIHALRLLDPAHLRADRALGSQTRRPAARRLRRCCCATCADSTAGDSMHGSCEHPVERAL